MQLARAKVLASLDPTHVPHHGAMDIVSPELAMRARRALVDQAIAGGDVRERRLSGGDPVLVAVQLGEWGPVCYTQRADVEFCDGLCRL